METIIKRSPLALGAWHTKVNNQKEPFLVDLSLRPKWDIQDRDLVRQRPCGITIPAHPGESVFSQNILINRLNPTQATLWHLAGESLEMPQSPAFTDVTDAYALVALIGPLLPYILEKVSALDIFHPRQKGPCLFQGPLLHVPCQVVRLGETDGNSTVLIACSRGYAQCLAAGLLAAGSEFGLHPVGQETFAGF